MEEGRRAMRAGLIALVIGASAGCNCGAVCGPGTADRRGLCLPIVDAGVEGEGGGEGGGEGEGEGQGESESEGEGDDVVCGPGTVLNGTATACTLLCRADQIFDGSACACPGGTVEAGQGCVFDAALCADGTVFDPSASPPACEPRQAPPRADDDVNPGNAPTPIIVPAVGEKGAELGGVIDRPGEELDSDAYAFAGVAGMRLQIQVASFGAEAASFVVVGSAAPGDESNLNAFQRFALPGEGRRALREVVLPLTGDYQIIVADKASFAGGLAAGGDDQTYALVVDQLVEPEPSVLLAAQSATGRHDVVAGFALDPTTLATELVDIALTSADPDTAAALWFLDAQGAYAEFASIGAPVAAFVPQDLLSGTVVHVDYIFHNNPSTGSTSTFTIDAKPLVVTSGPAAGELLEIDTGGEQLSFFSFQLDEAHVYRFTVELPLTTSQAVTALLTNEDFEIISGGRNCTRSVDDAGHQLSTCLRFVADEGEAGEHFLVLVNAAGDPVGLANNQVRIGFDQASVVNVGVVVADQLVAIPSGDALVGDFGASWLRVLWSDPLALTARATGVSFDLHNVVDTRFIATRVLLSGADDAQQTGGFSVLLRPRGPGPGSIAFSGSALPFPFETEPTNQSFGGAQALGSVDAVVADPDLSFGAAAGFASVGDVDFWSVEVTRAGILSVALGDGPFGPNQLLGAERAPDATVEIVDVDGATSLTRPGNTAAAFVGEPGTYFAKVVQLAEVLRGGATAPGFAGDYGLAFAFDVDGGPPASCDAPTVVSSAGAFEGDLRTGPRTARHVPPDARCFGHPPDVYDGAEDAYSISLPAHGALVASVDAQFDAALAVLPGGSCSGLCAVGADAAVGRETVQLSNDDDDLALVTLVVEGAAGAAGPYALEIQILGGVCRVGETRCNGGTLETCNDDGTALGSRLCAAGCEENAFDLIARCRSECGAPDTLQPTESCSGRNALRCIDGLIEPETCSLTCAEVGGGASCAVCSALGSSRCVPIVDDILAGAALVTCNDDGSREELVSCALGACNADSSDCLLSPPPDDVPAPVALCVAASHSCTDGIVRTCNGDGTALTTSLCDGGCVEGACVDDGDAESCATAAIVSNLPTSVEGDLSGAANDHQLGFGCTGFFTDGPDQVYAVDVPASARLLAQTHAAFDTALYILDSCPLVDDQQCVAGADVVGNDSVAFTNTADQGVRVFVVVDNGTLESGPYTVDLALQ